MHAGTKAKDTSAWNQTFYYFSSAVQLLCDERYLQIPIIVITADITQETRKELQQKKCDGYLLKPISQKALFTTLKDFMPYDAIANKCKSDDDASCDKLKISENFDRSLIHQVAHELKQLKNVIWPNLVKTMVYGDISKFAQDVQKIGKKYKLDGLKKKVIILT